jgi:hypothetical protein
VTGDVIGWLAYYSDWSGMSVFKDEINALRFAVENSMLVMPLRDGDDVRKNA